MAVAEQRKWAGGDGWSIPPADLELAPSEVHVWRAQLDLPHESTCCLSSHLTVEEQARAERYRFQRDRDRFVVGRWLLRKLIAFYLHQEPRAVELCYTAHGKPVMAQGSLTFNLSHAGELALYAFARERQVGIDVEHIRPFETVTDLAGRVLSPRELRTLAALPPSLRAGGFFTGWARKEAYIKARGEGLSLALDQFSVSLVPGSAARLLQNEMDPYEVSRWSFRSLDPGEGYVAAIAVEGHGWRLHCWECSFHVTRTSGDPRLPAKLDQGKAGVS